MAALLLFLILAQSTACAQNANTDIAGQLPGWWKHQANYGPAVAGSLTLDGRYSQWRAAIAGFDVAVSRKADAVQFVLPAKQGEFSGRLRPDGSAIEGFWMQPPGVTLGSGYATPVTLRSVSDKVWVGEVRPLPDRVTFYLNITRGGDGALAGFIRNPEFNFGLRRPFRIEVSDDHVSFINATRAGDVLRGRFDAGSGRLSMVFQGLGTFDFSRRDIESTPGIAPGPASPSLPRWVPPPIGDGWATAAPEDVGMRADVLQNLDDHVRRQLPVAVTTPYLHAILIARKGRLVFEEYFHGYDRDQVHDTRSASKTLTSILLGIAQQRHGGFDVDTPVLRLFDQYADLQHLDARKQRMTVGNLLTMTSGLACDDNDDGSPGNEDVMQSQSTQADWHRYALDLEMKRDPGGRQVVYCSAGINLLGGIVARRSGMPMYEFFQRYLAGPLQIDRYHMNLMPGGQGYAGGGIYLRPRDALKLGQLYLAGGRWNGKRIVDAAWVDASTRKHAQFDDAHGYGYAWHLYEVSVGERSYRYYAAGGNGGQFIIVVPELELVVMIAAGNYGDFKTWYPLQNLVATHVIPAIAETENQRRSSEN